MHNVVCLHSSQSSGAQWRPLLRFLEPLNCQVATPDLIGYGRSPVPVPDDSEAFRLQSEIETLRSHCAMMLQSPLHLTGHSYGAAVALKYARQYPQAVASLTLYEPVSFHILEEGDPARAEITAIAAEMEQQQPQRAAALFVDYWNYPGYFDALPARIQKMMVGQQSKVNADFAALLGEPAQLQDYSAIECPVLLMSGDSSPLSSRRVAQLLTSVIPNCQTQTIQGGHMAPVTEAGNVMPLMAKFLQQQMAETQ